MAQLCLVRVHDPPACRISAFARMGFTRVWYIPARWDRRATSINFLIVVDAVVIAFGIAGVIRARRANGSYVLPILILCVPTVYFLGSGLIIGEAIIAVFAVPSLVLAAVTCLEGLRLLFTRQRRTL